MRPVADVRIARGATAVTLSHQCTDGDGEPAAPTGTVTIGIVDAVGTTVVAAGTATSGSTTDPRTYSLSASALTSLALYTATWTDSGGAAVPQLVEIVGGYYFTVAQFSAWLGSAATSFSPTQVIAARRAAEETCEEITGVPWVPRYRRERFDGTGTDTLKTPDAIVRSVRSVRYYSDSTSYTSFTAEELALIGVTSMEARAGILVADSIWPAGTGNVVVEYEYGYDRPPRDLQMAVMKHTRKLLFDSTAPLSDQAAQWSGDGMLITRSLPNRDRTGLLDVDATYERYSHRVPGVA